MYYTKSLQFEIFFLFILILKSSIGHCSLPHRRFRVVIDPGHGGSDHGTVYTEGNASVSEKNITLSLAKKVAAQLHRRGFFVRLTRETDQEVPLGARTTLANRLNADAFISIHMNSTQNSSIGKAEGVETYILNNATDASSRRLARLENTVLSPSRHRSPEQKDVALILKDLRLDANLNESQKLACIVQNNLVSTLSPRSPSSRKNRGVKQALFHVLLGADMPSILIETGFLNNPRDRALILSSKGQWLMSKAIVNAVTKYQQIKKANRSLASIGRCKLN